MPSGMEFLYNYRLVTTLEGEQRGQGEQREENNGEENNGDIHCSLNNCE